MHLPCEFGPYRLTGLLGEGGMARVFEGHTLGPRALQLPVAVKVVKSEVAVGQDQLFREARLAASVRHPNVVDVLDVGEVDGVPYFAMERVQGLTLRQLLMRSALPTAACLDVLLQIAAGLAALHEGDIVHRDLKPDNVLVDADGRVRLVDFGIAAAAGSRERRRWGTLNYMSPEQAMGLAAGPPSDVFAFGALLVQILLRDRLWELSTLEEAVEALQRPHADIDAVRARLDRVLPGAAGVLDGCLEADPLDRWPNGQQLWEVLDGLGSAAESDLADRVVLPAAPAVLDTGSAPVVGRTDERAWLRENRDARVRTVVGPSGVGKSGVAEAEAGLAGVEVCTVNLRGADGPTLLKRVARALGLRHAEPAWVVGEALSGRPVLLVLDDVERPETLTSCVPEWLARAPALRLLVTASGPLGVAGEHVLNMGAGPTNTHFEQAWASLSPAMRAVLGACTVFRGFTLDDAVAVFTAAGIEQPWVHLTLLTERSLLVRRGDRLALDPVVGRRAADEADPALVARTRRAHVERYAEMGSDEAVANLIGPRAFELHARQVNERDNLRVALDCALELGHASAWRLARALHEVVQLGYDLDGLDAMTPELEEPRLALSRARSWMSQGRDPEALALLMATVEMPTDPATRAGIRVTLARLELASGHYAVARSWADEAVELADRHELRPLLVRALRVQAVLLRREGRCEEALKLLNWCARVCRSLADTHFLTRVLAVMGLVRMDLRQLDTARVHLQDAIAILRGTPDVLSLATQLGNLALVERKDGKLRSAHALLTEALAIYKRRGRVQDTAHVHGTLGAVCQMQGDHVTGEHHFRRAMELTEVATSHDQLPGALNDMGHCMRQLGRFNEAEAFFGQAREVALETGLQRALAVTDLNRLSLMLVRGDLEGADTLARELRGRPWFENPGYLGALEMRMGELARLTGRPQQALSLLDRAIDKLAGMELDARMQAMLERGQALLALGRRDETEHCVEAVRAWVEAQELGPLALTRLQLEYLERELVRAPGPLEHGLAPQPKPRRPSGDDGA